MNENRTRRTPLGSGAAVYQLKITLPNLPVWRRLLVRGDANLGLLHAVIQVAMGWTNSHLHQFTIGKNRYSDPRTNDDMGFGGPPDLDEGKATLMQVAPREMAKFTYEYDFGDSWLHSITVEKIHEPDAAHIGFAECLDGGYACPPEDCGGIGGYLDLLEVIQDSKHEQYESMMDWLGDEFDPEAFDTGRVNMYLRKLKWPRTTENHLAKVLTERDGYQG